MKSWKKLLRRLIMKRCEVHILSCLVVFFTKCFWLAISNVTIFCCVEWCCRSCTAVAAFWRFRCSSRKRRLFRYVLPLFMHFTEGDKNNVIYEKCRFYLVKVTRVFDLNSYTRDNFPLTSLTFYLNYKSMYLMLFGLSWEYKNRKDM